MFLRCKTAADLRQNAAGLIKAIEQGESIRAEDLTRFTRATLNKTTEQLDSADWADLSSAIDTVIASNLLSSSDRSEEHTSELQSLMRISYAVFCLKKKKTITQT